MTHNKRAKNSRQRGSWTHGWGAKKKHRGAGHRGGRGRAGSGKKGDAKKTLYWKDKDFGRGDVGFFSVKKTEHKTINLAHLASILEKLVVQNKVTKSGELYKIDMKELGYTKLLGTGKTTYKLDVTVQVASAKAIEKINATGGKVTLTAKPKVKKERKVAEKTKKAKSEPKNESDKAKNFKEE